MGWKLPFHPDDMTSTGKRWAHSLKTGDPYNTEYRCRSKDGEWRWMLGRALPMRNAKTGAIEKWFGTCKHQFSEIVPSLPMSPDCIAPSARLLCSRCASKTCNLAHEPDERRWLTRDLDIQVPTFMRLWRAGLQRGEWYVSFSCTPAVLSSPSLARTCSRLRKSRPG